MGHCVALYQQNHRQIERLELQLQQFGYTDLFAPLPPENPLDMLELRRPRQAPARRGVFGGEQEEVAAASGGGDGRPAAVHDADGQLQLGWSGREAHELQAGHSAGSSGLEEVTNRLAGVGLHPHLTALRPKTTLKALAPMTAAKALMREDTPSSLASPEALSPSMRCAPVAQALQAQLAAALMIDACPDLLGWGADTIPEALVWAIAYNIPQ